MPDCFWRKFFTLKGAFGAINGPLNRAVYEGATNVTIACETDNYPFLDWTIFPFSENGYYDLTTNGQLNPSFSELFAIDHPSGTGVYNLIVLNSTISRPDWSPFSTAAFYECSNIVTNSMPAAGAGASLVVISKYELF